MMLELPALAPFDMDDGDIAAMLSPAGMLGQADEIYEGGIPGWKQNPDALGVGLLAFVREIKPIADTTPKIAGQLFRDRLMALGVDASQVTLVPGSIRHDTSIGDGVDDDE